MPLSRSTLLQAPNLLTLGRVALVPFFVAAFWLPEPALSWTAFGLFAVAGATDWLDGRLARRNGQESDFGRVLDPIADKILVAAALLMLAATDRLSDAGVVAALIILVRELAVSGLREFLAGTAVLPVTRLAKAKTAVQFAAIAVLLVAGAVPALPLSLAGEALLWLGALLTVVTGAAYLRAGLRRMDG
ncbi:MAG: CDP-diacylglycerol--glycerol-3-phosphate 3-phosphatidyltransferase [Rhodospirillaceae bacterium]|nr:CDP-diacylglycerol--glycerol-3-phosphate 3-phosphatidyltransferase [Rhodospirillaceae bacterium]